VPGESQALETSLRRPPLLRSRFADQGQADRRPFAALLVARGVSIEALIHAGSLSPPGRGGDLGIEDTELRVGRCDQTELRGRSAQASSWV